MRSPKKILVTNIVALNPGDAAILWGMIEIIKRQYGTQTEIIVFDKLAATSQRYFPWAVFRQALFVRPPSTRVGKFLSDHGYEHWVLRAAFIRFCIAGLVMRWGLPLLARALLSREEYRDLREYLSADVIMSTGGTYLIENYDLSAAIWDYRLTLFLKKPLVFFTQTLGPFRNAGNRVAFARIFSKAAMILLRDARSRQHVLQLGVKSDRIRLAADAAFVLAADHRARTADAPANSARTLKVAVSVRQMTFFHPQHSAAYLSGMASLIGLAVEHYGAEVTLLSTCQGIPEYWTNDAKTADEVWQLLPEPIRKVVRVDRNFRQPRALVEVYGSFDAVIATRMHAAILALCAGVPTMGIAYEFKMEELFKEIGMPELSLRVEAFAPEALRRCLDILFVQRESLAQKIRIQVERMRDLAWQAQAALP